MLNKIYRLINPHQFSIMFEEINLKHDEIIVRPVYLSICAADQRYFQGNRDQDVLDAKLPMALIHESVGEVVYDPTGTYTVGDKVVMIPNISTNDDTYYKKNYDSTSYFRSSGHDGYMQDFIALPIQETLALGDIDLLAATMSELMSVSFNAIEDIKNIQTTPITKIGVWGNGNLGYLTTLALRSEFPDAQLTIVGRNKEKMKYFTDVDSHQYSNALPKDITFDLLVECVGGPNTDDVINQMIGVSSPQSIISLTGVSENLVAINTRLVLEKGLKIVGSSRSERKHFEKVVNYLLKNVENQRKVKRIISDVIEVRNINDMYSAFSKDLNNQFKTVMKWNV